MKVSVSQTVEITDEQRVRLAEFLDGAGSRKRQATRAECKDFIWLHGSKWEAKLSNDDVAPTTGGDDEDLLGLVPEDDGLDDLI